MYSIPNPVASCCKTLRLAGYSAYPVGGCVRDLLLHRTPSDWDVTTSALPDTVMRLFDKTVPTGLRHGTVTVFLDNTQIEVTTFRSESGYSDGRHPDHVSFDATLREDLSRRDFTINAMALDEKGSILDPFGGQNDLRRHIIRCVGTPEQRFDEDALRMLRAFRFAAQLDFFLDTATVKVIAAHPDWVTRVSAERIRVELEKAILASCPSRANGLFSLGLLGGFLNKSVPLDLQPLSAVEATPPARWSALCQLLKDRGAIESEQAFLRSLRLERRTIREILSYGVSCDLRSLALSGGELYDMGLRGPAIGKTQRMLLSHVLEHPEDNTHDILFTLAMNTFNLS